jgi:hypothetical protein
MRKRSKSSQLDLFPVSRRSPGVPREVRQKMIRLLAQMLRRHVAQSGERRCLREANHE